MRSKEHEIQMKTKKKHVALVTGGTRGIGRAIALRLAEDGVDVGIVGIKSYGTDVVRRIEAIGQRAHALNADVSSPKMVQEMVSAVEKALGSIDILVNNAAVADYHYSSAWKLDEGSWDRMLEVNLKGVYLCCIAVLPSMLRTGWGRIINISSTSGISGGTSGIHYAASKGGVNALSKALAREVAPYGITVNVVAPSKIDTDLFRRYAPGRKRTETIKKIPVGRLGKPEDIAEAVSYFAGEDSGYTTGQVLVVSGGY
jgi:NAD(P)-dependent dehydrogenase (short-subunit alcohol dehydrogenase family)